MDTKEPEVLASQAGPKEENPTPCGSVAASRESVSRRRALERLLELLVGAGAASWLPLRVSFGKGHEHSIPHTVEKTSVVSAEAVFFSPEQRAAVSSLVDLIIPPDDVSPGAKAAGVEGYVEFLVANAPTETQRAWIEGLQALDSLSRERVGEAFAKLPPDQQEKLIGELAGQESSPQSDAEKLFVRIKHAAAQGFYTSKIGLLDDLKYQGNTYVDGPATCQEQLGESPAGVCPASSGPATLRSEVSAPPTRGTDFPEQEAE